MSEEQMSVGTLLRTAREAQGLTIEQVVQQLKLARRQVEAMEGDHFADLPGNTFARGFVRNYARLLKLDAEPLLLALEAQLPQEREQVAFPQASENPSNLDLTVGEKSIRAGHWPVLAMMLLGLLVGAGLVWWYLQQPAMPEIALEEREVAASLPDAIAFTEASEIAASVTFESASALASEPAVLNLSASAPASAALAVSSSVAASSVASSSAVSAVRQVSSAVAARGIRIAASKESWVQIVGGDGQRVFAGMVTAGSEQAWAASAPYQIKIGNAPGAKLYYRGKPVDLAPFTRGDVATLELK